MFRMEEHLDNEIKVNEANFDDPSFDYVVEIKEGAKICFGSTIERDTSLIGNNLAPHQKRITPELFLNTGPSRYYPEMYSGAMYDVLFKKRSTVGVAGLANKASRFERLSKSRVPSPTKYKVTKDMGAVKKSAAPFGVRSKGRQGKVNNNPPASIYDIRKIHKCRKTKNMYNFGRPRAVDAVEAFCISIPVDTCLKCCEKCQGDYWEKDHSLFLCQLCWDEEQRVHEIYSKKQLREFQKIRNCSFMHSHEETSAAIRILQQNKINKKIRIENYLNLFVTCEKVRN